MAEDGRDQIGTLGKVTVYRTDAEAGLFGDLPHRRIDARRGEDLARGLNDRGDVAARIGADATIPCFALCCLIVVLHYPYHPC